MKHKFFALLLSAVLLLSMRMTVFAHEVPDLSQNGSITFLVNWEGEPVDGGEFRLYRAGDIQEDDGNYNFVLVKELADKDVSLDRLDDPALAAKLAQLTRNAGIKPVSAPVAEGKAVFKDVEPGLYVVVQSKACPGFSKMNPFLISMPHYSNGVYETEVVAMPKVPMQTEPTEPGPTEPTKPKDPELPQTGQLNWPIPLLASAGLVFFALGWYLCFKRTGETDAT